MENEQNEETSFNQIFNPNDVSRWLDYTDERYLANLIPEIGQLMDALRQYAEIVRKDASIENLDLVQFEKLPIDDKSVQGAMNSILWCTNRINRILDTSAAFLKVKRGQKK